MPGYALLPTMEEPTSNKTLRLSNEEMNERNAWIFSARERGMSVKDIAYEVGLKEPRVYQILNGQKKEAPQISVKVSGRYKTPMEAAVDAFRNGDRIHLECKNDGVLCMECFGDEMLIMDAYKRDTGWPEDWAWYGQARYIHPNMVIPEGVVIPDIAYVDCED